MELYSMDGSPRSINDTVRSEFEQKWILVFSCHPLIGRQGRTGRWTVRENVILEHPRLGGGGGGGRSINVQSLLQSGSPWKAQ